METATYLRHRRMAALVVLAAVMLPASSSAQDGDGGEAATGAPETPSSSPEKQEGPPRLGETIRLSLPLTTGTVEQMERFARRVLQKAEEAGARPVLIFEFEVPAGQAEFARQTEFTVALKLARFLSGKELNRARTVAYVPESLSGHAVLAAMACDELVMAPGARFGPVGAEAETVGPTERSAYREIAESRKTVPAEVALWMLDPSQEVLQVETEVSREYVTPEGLEELRRRRTIKSAEPLDELFEGRPGEFTGEEGRRLGLVGYMPAEREDVAEALDLPAEAMEEDPSLVGGWRAVRVDLKGPISAEMVTQAERLISDAIRERDVNFVCLWIDSPGGSPTESISRMAGFLAGLKQDEVRTVAYVPSQARADAALIALACDQLIVHPPAELGGSGAYVFTEDDIRHARQAIRDDAGPWGHRSWSLIAAMIDPELEVFRCRRPGELAYLSEEEIQERQKRRPDAPKWEKGLPVTRPGKLLLLGGEQAVEYGLARRSVDNFTELKEYYGLGDDPALLEPGWADFLVDALSSPGVAALLLTVAFVALYAELNVPGIGIGGFVAAVCFLLFFWSRFLGGTAEWLELMLFLTGIACMLFELFVLPGFGIFGLGGALMVIFSLVLASQTFILPRNAYQFAQLQNTLLTLGGSALGIIVLATLLQRFLPRAPIVSQMFLQPPSGEEAETISRRESMVDLGGLVGTRGVATTRLIPSGKARFGDTLLDVVTDGDALPRGAKVEIVEIHGNHVVVRAAR